MDWYAVLALDATASPQEIRKAYRRAALRYHPDKNPGDDGTSNADQFDLVSQAFRVLANPESREAYDRSLKGRHSPMGTARCAEKERLRTKLHEQERRESRPGSGGPESAARLRDLKRESLGRIATLRRILSSTRFRQPQFRTLQDGARVFDSVWEARHYVDEQLRARNPVSLQDSLVECAYSAEYERATLDRLPE